MNGNTDSGRETHGTQHGAPRQAAAGTPPAVDGLVNPSNVNFADPPNVAPRTHRIAYAVQSHAPRPSQSWALTLVLACLALGLAGGMVRLERSRVNLEQSRAISLANTDSLLQAQGEDLGKLLADPQTRMVRLAPADGAQIRDAALAWNPAQRTGFLFCDQLPTLDLGVSYEVWAATGAEQSHIASIHARPGISVYRFRPDNALNAVRRWEVTAGSRSAAKAPILIGIVP